MNNFKFTDKNISDNPDDFSFSVYEIHKEQQTKENNRIILYNKILKQIFIKIKIAVETCESYIFFKLPEYIIGYPIYNITECVFYIQNFLTSKGFEHKYCSHLIIFITWTSKSKSIKLENLNNIQQNQQPIQQLLENNPVKNSTFRQISDYQSHDDFLYNSNKNKNKNNVQKKKEIFLNF
jgi:hypothetical protein